MLEMAQHTTMKHEEKNNQRYQTRGTGNDSELQNKVKHLELWTTKLNHKKTGQVRKYFHPSNDGEFMGNILGMGFPCDLSIFQDSTKF